MTRKVIGEGADRFANSNIIGRIPLAFDPINFTSLQERFQLFIGERHVHLRLKRSVSVVRAARIRI